MTNQEMTKEIERRRRLWPHDAVTIIDALVMEITRLQEEVQRWQLACCDREDEIAKLVDNGRRHSTTLET